MFTFRNPIPFLLWGLVISGCMLTHRNMIVQESLTPTSFQPSRSPTIMVNIPTPTQSYTPTTRPMFSATLSPTPTPKTAPTASPTLPSLVHRSCPIYTAPGYNLEFNGSLIIGWEEDGVAALSYPSMKPKVLFTGMEQYIGSSPYTGSIAWVGKDGFLHYRKPNRAVYKMLMDPRWVRLQMWLTDDSLIMGYPHKIEESFPPAEDEFDVITPKTGNVKHYQLKIPGYFANIGVAFEYLWAVFPVYDPTLARAIYAWGDPQTLERGLGLWDIQNNKEIWNKSQSHYGIEHSFPEWKMDGSQVALSAHIADEDSPIEIFSVTANGQEKQLTRLGEVIHDQYEIMGVFWSPDGRYIAFIVHDDILWPSEFRWLYVLDTQTGFVTDYCTSPVNFISWSPDSDKIFIAVRSHLVVLDVKEDVAQELSDVHYALGWVSWTIP